MNKFSAGLMILVHLLSAGCNNEKKSFPETEREKFRFTNKEAFKIDSQLTADLKTHKLISLYHELFDTTIGGPGYLYSWQEGNAGMSQFTVVKDTSRFERGLHIYYYILDENDSLLLWEKVAGNGTEGILRFETQSKFLNKDTLVTASSVTQWYDLDNDRKMMPPKGDTTFKYLITRNNRLIGEQVYKEVKQLNFK